MLKLHNSFGEIIYINSVYVIKMQEGARGGTILVLINETINVTETITEVLKSIYV